MCQLLIPYETSSLCGYHFKNLITITWVACGVRVMAISSSLSSSCSKKTALYNWCSEVGGLFPDKWHSSLSSNIKYMQSNHNYSNWCESCTIHFRNVARHNWAFHGLQKERAQYVTSAVTLNSEHVKFSQNPAHTKYVTVEIIMKIDMISNRYFVSSVKNISLFNQWIHQLQFNYGRFQGWSGIVYICS